MPTNVCIVKAMVFPVVTYGHENWTRKKAEHQSTDAFEQWCWRRLLRVPWTERSNQSILLKVNQFWWFIRRTDAKAEALILFDNLMPRANSLEKTLMLGKIEGMRRSGWQRMRWLNGITDSMDMSWASSEGWRRIGKLGALQSMGLQSRTWLSDWTTISKTTLRISTDILFPIFSMKLNLKVWT